ncbi:MAG: 30S ribosomal protein S17e [Nanoarchaeota archaeon]|nr:30S ribosomal protein S17e [Nanoarchaeota archaeon]
MGRIRTTYIKRKSREILEKYKDKFTKDFEHNKKVLDEIAEIPSKQLRNKIAGCIVHLIKSMES